jgi:hypothetical protein
MDWAALQRSIAAWDNHARADPVDAVRRVRQVVYLLHIFADDQQSFMPLRLLIGWANGIPFAQQGGRSIDMKDHFASLAELGLARIGETSPFFDAIWNRYDRHCAELGQPPACYIGDNPRTGRIFWTYPI